MDVLVRHDIINKYLLNYVYVVGCDSYRCNVCVCESVHTYRLLSIIQLRYCHRFMTPSADYIAYYINLLIILIILIIQYTNLCRMLLLKTIPRTISNVTQWFSGWMETGISITLKHYILVCCYCL